MTDIPDASRVALEQRFVQVAPSGEQEQKSPVAAA
jgi:hypothetical protein